MAVDERVQLEHTTPTIITIIPKMYLVAPAVSIAVRPCVHDGMTFNLGMATHLPGDSICSSSRACDTHRRSEATLSNASYRHHQRCGVLTGMAILFAVDVSDNYCIDTSGQISQECNVVIRHCANKGTAQQLT
jgi:hypothetical protein